MTSLLLTLWLTGASAAEPSEACPSVRVDGSMLRFKAGDLSQTVALADLTWTPSTIALGATAGKTAEITAVDGRLWLVGPAGDGVSVSHEADGVGGSLLVSSGPIAWDAGRAIQATDVPTVLAAVGDALPGTPCAKAEAVPFIVRGKAASASWSVVGQPEGARGSVLDAEVVLVGVRAPSQRGIYVPGHLDGHVHVVIPSANVAGHLGDLRLEPGATLHLPAVSAR